MPSLTVIQKPIIQNGRILTGLAARKAQLASELGLPQEVKPGQMEHRIGIVFDDSSSMHSSRLEAAKAGVEEFLRSCEPEKTAVTIYLMNAEPLVLSTNLPALAILVKNIRANGGTPLVQTLFRMLKENKLTRAIVFSDGAADSYSEKDYAVCIEYGIPIDTVSIDSVCTNTFMQKLAADTGGIFLQFVEGKSNFRTSFKYLSPGLRYMLADKSFVTKIQGS